MATRMQKVIAKENQARADAFGAALKQHLAARGEPAEVFRVDQAVDLLANMRHWWAACRWPMTFENAVRISEDHFQTEHKAAGGS